MSRPVFYILFLLLPLFSQGQDRQSKKLEREWEKITQKHVFQKSKKYEGPDAEPYIQPTEINEQQPINSGSGNARNKPYQGTPYNARQIRDGRGAGNGDGTLADDPNITPPEPIDFPDVDTPDIDTPDVNINPPSMSMIFWKYVGIILLLVLLAFIVYYFLRNQAPANKRISFEPLEEDMNPASIPKTELELRLEEALNREDYKECVRIYFLFTLKNLIERRLIFWKKEKTTIHYHIELSGRPAADPFKIIGDIYDLVWYGDYTIDKKAYTTLQPKLEGAYHTIERQE